TDLDIKPKVSGEVVWVGVKPGDKVVAGQALLQLDSTDAVQAVKSAELSLATAQLQYQRDQAQAPIDYQNSQNTIASDQESLANDYTDSYTKLSATYLDLSPVMTGLNNSLYGYDLSPNSGQWNIDVLANLFQGDDRTTATSFKDTAV